MSIPVAGSMTRVILIWICRIKIEQAQLNVFIFVNNQNEKRASFPSDSEAADSKKFCGSNLQ